VNFKRGARAEAGAPGREYINLPLAAEMGVKGGLSAEPGSPN